jgi:hypothetical protein
MIVMFPIAPSMQDCPDLLLVMAIVCPESIENFQEAALKTAQ